MHLWLLGEGDIIVSKWVYIWLIYSGRCGGRVVALCAGMCWVLRDVCEIINAVKLRSCNNTVCLFARGPFHTCGLNWVHKCTKFDPVEHIWDGELTALSGIQIWVLFRSSSRWWIIVWPILPEFAEPFRSLPNAPSALIVSFRTKWVVSFLELTKQTGRSIRW
jgi:hypothetical protein